MKLRKSTQHIVDQLENVPAYVQEMLPGRSSSFYRMINTAAWVTAGLGAVAVGLIVGRELRQRYKFTHQTPYDFYAHAGDRVMDEFGVGV